MIVLQLTSGSGPAECCLAVAKAAERLRREAAERGVDAAWVERVPGPEPGTWHSLLVRLAGDEAVDLAAAWCGTLLWVCPSPYRPGHRRKNWFIGATRVSLPQEIPAGEIRFESLRSSGPGGQHVNTTNSAVRATHVASGYSVKVQCERSQHANKKLAILLVRRHLEEIAERRAGEHRARLRSLHQALERGKPVRRFAGMDFVPLP